MLVPMLRVARPMLSASVASVSYTFCFLLAVDILRQAFSGIRMIGLAIIVAETLAAIIVLFGMRRHYRQIIAERAESSGLILLKAGRFLLMIVLLVALLAGAAGYARLARLLTPGILVGAVLVIADVCDAASGRGSDRAGVARCGRCACSGWLRTKANFWKDGFIGC